MAVLRTKLKIFGTKNVQRSKKHKHAQRGRKKWNLKIKTKFLLLMLFLVLLVSASIMGATIRFSNTGKDKVLHGVAEKLGQLQQASEGEFKKFTEVANQGIAEASGMKTIENIISIAKNSQTEFVGVIDEVIRGVGDHVTETLASQNEIISSGLDELLSSSTDSMNQIMEFDNKSQGVLANSAIFNIDSLKTSSMDGLSRFGRLIKSMKEKLQLMQDKSSEDIDNLLIELIAMLENTSVESDQLVGFVMEAFEAVKSKAQERKDSIYRDLAKEFDLHSKVMAEELNLVTNKVHYAITGELENASTIQEEETEKVINKLLESQVRIQESIVESSDHLGQSIAELKTNVPERLKKKGDEASQKINEKTADAVRITEVAQEKVASKVTENTKNAIEDFESGIADSKDLIKKTLEDSLTETFKYSTAIALACVIFGAILAIFLVARILKPVTTTSDILRDIAEGEGDLTRRLEINTNDEVGELANGFNTFVDKIQEMIKKIADNANTLDKSSSNLLGISKNMSLGANETSSKANNVASAAEEMSANMNIVTDTTGEASSSVGAVATSADQMTSTINEIASNTEKARNISGVAAEKAKKASDRVDNLGKAALDIGKVTETISEISEQTNLLALNATIEAARAGDAGRGFAVVANEIKDLARQTAAATQEIRGRIEGIQGSTDTTVVDIKEISDIIQEVSDIVSTIASAMEEQSVTTKEIASNVIQAAQGIEEMNENVKQSSRVSHEISEDISEVNQAANEISSNSIQLSSSAEELSGLSNQLKEMVGRFKV